MTARTDSVALAFRSVVKDALIQHYGSLRAAAATLGMDPAQLTRELQTGDFKLMRRLNDDPEALATVVIALFHEFGTRDQNARAKRLVRELRAQLTALETELAEAV